MDLRICRSFHRQAGEHEEWGEFPSSHSGLDPGDGISNCTAHEKEADQWRCGDAAPGGVRRFCWSCRQMISPPSNSSWIGRKWKSSEHCLRLARLSQHTPPLVSEPLKSPKRNFNLLLKTYFMRIYCPLIIACDRVRCTNMTCWWWQPRLFWWSKSQREEP